MVMAIRGFSVRKLFFFIFVYKNQSDGYIGSWLHNHSNLEKIDVF